jgi:hypothetical protein
MPSAREITAYHEAGRARPAVRRGATVNQIDISTDDVGGNYLGNTHVDIDPFPRSVLRLGGPWACARS